MCGITGFIDFKGRGNKGVLERMTNSLIHRGPDGEGYYFCNTNLAQLALGHRRLSIIDLSSAASQPMSFDGMQIVFNGEIYNYNEIRTQLQHKGYSFKTHSDTEVILFSLREWGMKAIDAWKGMFSIVVVDEKNKKVRCIRDRAGVKPFYYYWNDDLFIFGSELKSIMAHPSFPKKISNDSVASYLQYGYVPAPYSIFENTYKLKQGHYLTLDLQKHELSCFQYWNVYDYFNKPKFQTTLDGIIKETEHVLTKAFQYRLVSDVPVGVFLSGGYDSTCVSALLQKDRTEKIKTFTIGSVDPKYNEAPFAKEIAHRLGTEHTEYYCSPSEALDIIPDLPYWYDEPFADSSSIPTILVSKLARKKVTVALSADAGDEIFAGYNRYEFLTKYGNRINRIPSSLRKVVAKVMDNMSSEAIPYFRNRYNFHSHYQKIKYLIESGGSNTMLKNSVSVFSTSELNGLMSRTFKDLNTDHTSNELKKEFNDDLSSMLAIDFRTYMSDDILQKVDRATMSVSLEGREPFLDQDIIEFAAQIPSEYKLFRNTKKYILKQIVYKYIPKNIMDRPKMGFSIPVEDWLSKELKDLVIDYLNEKKLSHNLFNKDYVIALRDSFFAGKKNMHLKIWSLCMFQMWYEKWMKTSD